MAYWEYLRTGLRTTAPQPKNAAVGLDHQRILMDPFLSLLSLYSQSSSIFFSSISALLTLFISSLPSYLFLFECPQRGHLAFSTLFLHSFYKLGCSLSTAMCNPYRRIHRVWLSCYELIGHHLVVIDICFYQYTLPGTLRYMLNFDVLFARFYCALFSVHCFLENSNLFVKQNEWR